MYCYFSNCIAKTPLIIYTRTHIICNSSTPIDLSIKKCSPAYRIKLFDRMIVKFCGDLKQKLKKTKIKIKICLADYYVLIMLLLFTYIILL